MERWNSQYASQISSSRALSVVDVSVGYGLGNGLTLETAATNLLGLAPQ